MATDGEARIRAAAESTQVQLEGPAGRLEGLLEQSSPEPSALALVCHPHPLQQGTMHNKVVHMLARSFCGLGARSLRFNFRGVGGSDGEHADGEGEVDDALAAAGWLAARWPGMPLYVAGFSFGAVVALRAAGRIRPAGLVTVAPPVGRLPPGFEPWRGRWVVVQGRDDEIVDADGVEAWVARLDASPAFEMLDGTGHFFHGRLNVLRDVVESHFARDFAWQAEAGAC